MSRQNKILLWTIENKFDELNELLKRQYPWKNHDTCVSFNNHWEIIGENDFTTINNRKIHYLKTYSHIEVPIIANASIFQSLPTNERTKYEICVEYFIEKGDSIVCLVCGSGYSGSKIRNRLMKSSNKDKIYWGRVKFKDIVGYTLKSNFYFWLLYNKNKILKYNDNTIKIIEIEGFQSSESRNKTGEVPNDYNGNGSEIDKCIPFQSIISGNGNLVSLHINLVYDDISFDFTINYNCSVEINFSRCGKFCGKTPQNYENAFLILNLYSAIIPTLRLLYWQDEKRGCEKDVIEFRKQTALHVIKNLMIKNNIKFNAIKGMFD